MRFEAMAVEEVEDPRPHYRIEVRGTIRPAPGPPDPTVGLLSDEIVMIVRLPTDVGSDLVVIRKAACQRALSLIETVLSARDGTSDTVLPAPPRKDSVDASA